MFRIFPAFTIDDKEITDGINTALSVPEEIPADAVLLLVITGRTNFRSSTFIPHFAGQGGEVIVLGTRDIIYADGAFAGEERLFQMKERAFVDVGFCDGSVARFEVKDGNVERTELKSWQSRLAEIAETAAYIDRLHLEQAKTAPEPVRFGDKLKKKPEAKRAKAKKPSAPEVETPSALAAEPPLVLMNENQLVAFIAETAPIAENPVPESVSTPVESVQQRPPRVKSKGPRDSKTVFSGLAALAVLAKSGGSEAATT